MKDRLQQLMLQEGLTAAKIAELVDVQPSAISHILGGRNNPGFDFIKKILETFPNLNARWFVLGEPPMYSALSRNEKKMPLIDIITDDKIIGRSVSHPPHKDHPIPEQRSIPTSAMNNNELHENKSNRKIEKIILFYSDNSFETYEKD